jgi:CheY-like chemotaxis protein
MALANVQPHEGEHVMHALIVDDDGFIREIVRLSLELMAGWAVSVAESGSDGIEQARILTPDVILLDVMMPGIDGVETLRGLADDPATRNIPVIFLTAKTEPCEQQRLDDAGARGLITKPFDPLSLAHDVEVILGGPLR